MKIYIVTRTDEVRYDEHDSVVVVAVSRRNAVQIAKRWALARPNGSAEDPNVWDDAVAEPIDNTKSGVVHASFVAG